MKPSNLLSDGNGPQASARSTFVMVLPWDPNFGGGVNQVVLNLYREMVLTGEVQPLIVVSKWSAFRPVESQVDGHRIVYMRLAPPWSERGSILSFLKWMLLSPVYLANLMRFCRRHRVVAFNFHYPLVNAFPIALLRFLKLYRGAVIFSFHGADLRGACEAGRSHRMLWRFLFRCATAVVACSSALAADVQRFAGKKFGNIRAVHNGLNIQQFLGGVDRKAALPVALRGRQFILSIAHFRHGKGLDVLIRAFADVWQTNPELALCLVGGSGDEEYQLRSLVVELGLGNKIFFFANVPHSQVGLFLKDAKVFCLPSRSEAFGIVILEAGAYRLPVVASRVGGIPEIVKDGETGLLVEPGDAMALARALNRILTDKQLARDLGEGLFRRVADDFSWKRAYREYRAMLPQLGSRAQHGDEPVLRG